MDYLVMDCLEGETLSDRLKRGALPLDQALRTAIEIGGALDQAVLSQNSIDLLSRPIPSGSDISSRL
jgi:hypothetical protein